MASSDQSLWTGTIDPSLPAGSEKLSEGDDAIRHFKKVVNDTLPQLTGAVNFTHTKLNHIDQHSGASTTQLIFGVNAKNNNVTNAALTITAGEINCNGLQLTNVGSAVTTDLDVPNKGYNDARYYTQTQVDSVIDGLYPIGTIYENAVNNLNPALLLGFGTWVLFGQSRTTVCIDVLDPDYDTPSKIGGAKTSEFALTGKTAGHELTENEMPTHDHHSGSYDGARDSGGQNESTSRPVHGNYGHVASFNTGPAGLGAKHDHDLDGSGSGSIVQPYVVVYRWARTA